MFANNRHANILPVPKTEAHLNVDVSKSVIHKNIKVKEFMLNMKNSFVNRWI